MTSREERDGWRLLVLHPQRALLWIVLIAATGCFGQAALWILQGYFVVSFNYIVWLLGLGGFLSLVASIGFYLERR